MNETKKNCPGCSRNCELSALTVNGVLSTQEQEYFRKNRQEVMADT